MTPRTKNVLLIALGFAICIAVMVVPSCALFDSTVTGLDGKQVTPQEYAFQIQKQERDLMKEEAAARKKAADDLAAAELAASSELRILQTKAQVGSAKVQASLARGEADANEQLANLQAETGSGIEAVQSALATQRKQIADNTKALMDSIAASRTSLEDSKEMARLEYDTKNAQRQQWLGAVANNPFVSTAAASVGVNSGQIATLLGGGAAVGVFNMLGRRREEAKAAQAKKEAEDSANKASEWHDQAWDESEMKQKIAQKDAQLQNLLAALPPEMALRLLGSPLARPAAPPQPLVPGVSVVNTKVAPPATPAAAPAAT